MNYYIVKSIEWDSYANDLTTFHYLIAAETYADAVMRLTNSVGEDLNSFTIQEAESFDGIFSLKENEYETMKEGR